MKTKSIVVTTMFVGLLYLPIFAQQEEVRIEPNTKITINSGTTMYITTGDLVLESDANGDVSLIVLGELEINDSGKTNAQRYLPGSAQTWHYLGAPVSGMAISGSGFEPAVDVDDFYAWDEPDPGTWVNYKTSEGQDPTFLSVNGSDNFVPGKGYMVAYNSENPTKTFSGTLNTGDVTFNLKNSGSGTYNGWNLISNPYSTSIDWYLVDHTEETSMFQDVYAYLYDPTMQGGGDYIYKNGGSQGEYIGSNQGFFVLANTSSNNQDFTFTDAMQTHGGGSYMKSTILEDKLILRLSSENYYNETTIILRDQSSFIRDRNDALKLYSYNPSVPQFYSISLDEINLAINSIPNANFETPISLGIRIPVADSYTISIQTNTINFSSNILYLEDKVTNKIHKIIDEDYQFTSPEGDINNRFILHFGITDINNNDEPIMQDIWAYNNQLTIISETKQARLEIFDMQGRLISSKTIHINGKYSEMLYLSPGIYIVRLRNSNMVKSKRITIR